MSGQLLHIRFASGTGNTCRVARWIGSQAEESGATADACTIDAEEALTLSHATQRSTLILASPTHGFTTPWHTLRFALSLPWGRGMAAYCLATRAGFRVGSFITDGIAGTCAFLLALVLLFKGYRVRGTVHVNMPSNWYSLHPMQKKKTVDMLLERAAGQTRQFTSKVLAGQPIWLTGNNAYEAVLGLALAPVSLLYLALGRICLAKLYFASNRCNGCGLCATTCPTGSIVMRGKRHVRPFWKYSCESCMRSATFCPRNAVEASHSWMLILYMVSTIPAAEYLLGWLSEYLPTLQTFDQFWITQPLKLLYVSLVFIIPYPLFNLMLRVRLLNRLFTLTTLTAYWGRYKEPAIKLRDLSSRGGEQQE